MTETTETPDKPTTADVMASLNGFDEIAIAKHFGADVTDLKHRPFMFLRSLIFVLKRRDGLKDGDAKTFVLNLTLADVNEYFGDEGDQPEGADLAADVDEDADPKE